MARDRHNARILGDSLYARVASSRVLLVGAGGIGCELLKNLVLSGFKNIEVIDLDTIDISNLNRQFLFQKQHVKKSKAHVARESALRFNPTVHIVAHQANIKEPQFSVAWFARFTIVFNALDNLEARRHVNQMCLAANVPLIESGTTGYLGQAYVIKKGITECFDCYPKPTPTTYPVCTIRSTPSAPIHCIVWAKSYLFNQLFGNSEEEEDLKADDADSEQELAALKRETEELKKIKSAMGTDAYPQLVFDKVFSSDIERLLSMKDMWKHRTPPKPLKYNTMSSNPSVLQSLKETRGGIKDQKVWTLEECFEVFKDSVTRLSEQLRALPEGSILSFDKDDDDALDFVTATANIRAHIFSIPQKSRFEVKSMAGNIIPAIATTNAIIAGVAVMKGFAVLQGNIEKIKRTYLSTVGQRPQLLILEEPSKPNPDCSVCRVATAAVSVGDFEKVKLRDLVDNVITAQDAAAMDGEDVTVMDGSRVIYDMDLESNLDMTLSQLSIREGTILRVDDDRREVDLVLQKGASEQAKVRLLEPILLTEKKKEPSGLKRRRSEDEEMEDTQAKRPRVSSDEVVEIEDTEKEGVILLD